MLGKNPATTYAQGMKSGYGTVQKREQSTSARWSNALQLNMGTPGTLRVSRFMKWKHKGVLQKLSEILLKFHFIRKMWHCL